MILAALFFLAVILLMGGALRAIASALGGLIFIGVLVYAYGWSVLAVAFLGLLWVAYGEHRRPAAD